MVGPPSQVSCSRYQELARGLRLIRTALPPCRPPLPSRPGDAGGLGAAELLQLDHGLRPPGVVVDGLAHQNLAAVRSSSSLVSTSEGVNAGGVDGRGRRQPARWRPGRLATRLRWCVPGWWRIPRFGGGALARCRAPGAAIRGPRGRPEPRVSAPPLEIARAATAPTEQSSRIAAIRKAEGRCARGPFLF